jgi:hypothetical protein
MADIISPGEERGSRPRRQSHFGMHISLISLCHYSRIIRIYLYILPLSLPLLLLTIVIRYTTYDAKLFYSLYCYLDNTIIDIGKLRLGNVTIYLLPRVGDEPFSPPYYCRPCDSWLRRCDRNIARSGREGVEIAGPFDMAWEEKGTIFSV